MSDTIVARGAETTFKPHDEGQFVAACVDVIALGEAVEQYQNQPAKLATKCALVFRTGEKNDSGEYIDIGREFTVAMSEKANLRKFLEQWRGKPYTAAEASEGVPLHKLTGQPALLTVTHKVSAKGNVYAVIAACVGVPKQMKDTVKKHGEYKRAEFWEEKKARYAEAAQKFRGEQESDDLPPDFGNEPNDDSLPF